MTPTQTTGLLFVDGGASLTLTLTGVTAGNLLIQLASVGQNNNTTALPTPTGFSLGIAPTGATFVGDSTRPTVGIFYKENASSGSNSCVQTDNPSNSFFSCILSEWPIQGTGNNDKTSSGTSNTATSGNTGTTATLAQANELVVAVIDPDDVLGFTALSSPASSGYTSLGVENNNATHEAAEMSYKTVASTAGVIASWTWTGAAAYVAAIMTFKIPGGGSFQPAWAVNATKWAGIGA